MDTSVLFKYSNDSFCFVFTLACQSLLWPKLTTTRSGGLRLACQSFLWSSTQIICFKIQDHVLGLHGKLLRNLSSKPYALVVKTAGSQIGGSGFNSHQIHGRVAQPVELFTYYEKVASSNLVMPTFCAYPQPHRSTSSVFLVASNNDDTECSRHAMYLPPRTPGLSTTYLRIVSGLSEQVFIDPRPRCHRLSSCCSGL